MKKSKRSNSIGWVVLKIFLTLVMTLLGFEVLSWLVAIFAFGCFLEGEVKIPICNVIKSALLLSVPIQAWLWYRLVSKSIVDIRSLR